ncbi:hypothetical protein QYZ88_011135 [Lachnospiraceae bacterium C1.1]|nr:hypothetical protein [Lachnospiraceae bacterium C1.1]
MNADILPVVLVCNAFLAIGIVMFINGLIFRKRFSIPLMIVCLIGGSFLTLGAAIVDIAVIVTRMK